MKEADVIWISAEALNLPSSWNKSKDRGVNPRRWQYAGGGGFFIFGDRELSPTLADVAGFPE